MWEGTKYNSIANYIVRGRRKRIKKAKIQGFQYFFLDRFDFAVSNGIWLPGII